MKSVPTTAAEVRARIDAHMKNGFHVDSRLVQEVGRPGVLSLVTLETQDEFMNLVWQAVSATRVLAPRSAPRALKDCAARLESWDWDFGKLVAGGHTWFEKCVPIDAGFDLTKFGWVAITPLTDGEKKETPHGSHYICDGVHKSLVLAKRLIRKESRFAPIQVLLLEPRRS